MNADPETDREPRDGGWIEELAELEDEAAMEGYLAARPRLHRRAAVEQLAGAVVGEARMHPTRAAPLRRPAGRLAELAGDDHSQALGLKAAGHIAYLNGRYGEALALYRECQGRFFAVGAEIEAAMNLCSSSLQTLSLLGRYDEAAADLARARAILERHGDSLLLARLTSNEGNLLFRQDRHPEAIDRYQSALAEFRRSGGAQDVAVALLNLAVVSIAVGHFSEALELYREMSAHCTANDLPLLALQADYNIAYLYYYRGEYRRALEAYQRTRKTYEALGEPYHLALCDLDQAEIYLELNLFEDGARLARRALAGFERLGNSYEAAKATTFLAIAEHRRGRPAAALPLFAEGRDRFVREGNEAWIAMSDLYRAAILTQEGQADEARRLARGARRRFLAVPWASRAALAELCLAQLELSQGHPAPARQHCRAALARLEGLDQPALDLRAWALLGRIEELAAKPRAAQEAYRRAHGLLEDLRTHLGSEESRIAFLEDKLEIYESLVWMTLELGGAPGEAELREAFTYVEQAKSRSLADLIASGGGSVRAPVADDQELVQRLRAARQELTSCHHELGRLLGLRSAAPGQASAEAPAPPVAAAGPGTRFEAVDRRSRECEARLLETLGELRARNSELAALETGATVDLDGIRAAIPKSWLLLEYFEARGLVYACLVGRERLEIRPLAVASEVRNALELFLSQISKFQLGQEYLELFGRRTEETMTATLRMLYDLLLEPLATTLEAEHLVVVPHGHLHRLPFHALLDGDVCLLDRHSFSYAPSASLYSRCRSRRGRGTDPELVLGIPDERAPEILAEVEAVAEALPGARVLVGEEASEERLRELGSGCRLLHIATHGFFRRDNPMFSAIQLGTSRLTLFDLYQVELGAELVVLSGCATGLNVVQPGDELIGLTRGLLYAGAPSVVATLWDVHDRSTALFMKGFYRRLAAGTDRSRALCATMRELREEHPSPFYWAPFLLIGKADAPVTAR